MNAKFIDTNIVVYLFSGDEPEKRSKAENIVEADNLIISTQVLNEFANVMFRKFKLSPKEVSSACKELTLNFDIVTVNPSTIFNAIKLKERYGFSYFDSAILSSAIEAGCDTLYSEDLQHGQTIENQLRIINPFI